MLIAAAFIAFAAMLASWLVVPEKKVETVPATSMVPAGAAAD